MRQNLIGRGGFDPPLPRHARRRQRTALALFASIALALSTVVAATVVSIGFAQADMQLLVATQSGDGTLAVAFLVGCIVVGTIVGEIYRRRHERR